MSTDLPLLFLARRAARRPYLFIRYISHPRGIPRPGLRQLEITLGLTSMASAKRATPSSIWIAASRMFIPKSIAHNCVRELHTMVHP